MKNAQAEGNGNSLTELVFLLDRSGSMTGLETDTIGGYNALLQQHKQQPGEAVLSTVLFDNHMQVLHDRVDVQQAKPLTSDDYFVRGSTALLDAVGGAIHHISTAQRYLPEGYKPDKTILVITTDGFENASTRYTFEQVKAMIKQQEKAGWEFLFLGANIDAAKEAGRMGIRPSRAVTYCADNEGTEVLYGAVAQATCSFRKKSAVSDDWSRPIMQNAKRRR